MMADSVRAMQRLPEDVVEYSIFLEIPTDIDTSEGIKDFMESLADAIIAHLSSKLVKYIWQHENFTLRPVVSSQDSIPSHLHGSTCFGDNIDDEWFIVSLLYEITREFSGSVVRVNDNDEEFLLIEAADELPKWLDPESAENRVYIYNGDIHVIPIPQSTEAFEKYPLFTPTLTEGVTCVRDCACATRCSQAIQNCINKRLSCFPKKTVECIHRVNCYLPTPLAVLLTDQPALISAGVRSFYYRDPLELKACRPMKRFKPDDLVRTRVQMTRCLYAQLVQQQFTPDRRSGWTVVSPSNPEFLERDIGVKLAHGFEILCSKCTDDDDDGTDVSDEVLDSNNRWLTFKKSLTRTGYFRGEIEGSKLHTELTKEARQFYRSQIQAEESDSNHVGQQVLRHLRHLAPRFDQYRRAERKLPPSDDDDWMTLTPEQTDEMIKATRGMVSAGDGSEAFDLSKIAESMNAFVEHESGIDGAEFPKDSEAEAGDGQFESSGLIKAMQKIFDFPEDEDSSGSDMSEYDWSEESEEDLGSPTKMPSVTPRSSMSKSKSAKSKGSSSSMQQQAQAKTVRFSTPDTHSSESPSCGKAVTSTPPKVPPRPFGTPPTPHPRPSNLQAPPRPSGPPPPLPSNHASASPPPVPSRPHRRQVKPRPLSKPNAIVKPSAPPPPPPAGGKRDKKLEALMDAMDRELAATDVGKSFERMPNKAKVQKSNKDSARAEKGKNKTPVRDINDEDDDFRPVDVDLNIVKNTLKSYKAQQGLPGPASNILAGFGIQLPEDQVNGKS